jgi:hypothetical protein
MITEFYSGNLIRDINGGNRMMRTEHVFNLNIVTNFYFVMPLSLTKMYTRAQVQTLYQQQIPHLQSNTQTYLDIAFSSGVQHPIQTLKF